jgi:hypothetical protein
LDGAAFFGDLVFMVIVAPPLRMYGTCTAGSKG